MTKFTEFEIVTLWNHFKADFPSGIINQSQLSQMIKKTFPKYKSHHYQKEEIKYELFRCQHPEVVSSNLFRFYKSSNVQAFNNVFRVFDQDSSGAIRFHELLLAFSMSMRGSGNKIAL